MNKLTALPVSGDSFLLRRGRRTILVDGGYSSRTLNAALSAPSVAVHDLDIVVCTHADKDHAGGLTDLLDSSSIRVGEFWLPGSWSDPLPQLLRHPDQVVDELVAELDSFVPGAVGDLDEGDEEFESRVHAVIANERRDNRREGRGNGVRAEPEQQRREAGLTWLKQQTVGLELNSSNDIAAAKAFARGRRLIRYRTSKRQFDRRWAVFWVDTINTADRIRKIAVQAIRHNVAVRWFDFTEFAKTRQASGGEPGVLVPLNAVELVIPPTPVMMRYTALLTPVNEECLVFFSPGTDCFNDLGVVFTESAPRGPNSNARALNLAAFRTAFTTSIRNSASPIASSATFDSKRRSGGGLASPGAQTVSSLVSSLSDMGSTGSTSSSQATALQGTITGVLLAKPFTRAATRGPSSSGLTDGFVE